MKIYVYVSESCKQQARIYQLEQQLQQIETAIEQAQNFLQFEIFEYPYYVRKRISYRYRLLAKVTEHYVDGEHYRIFSFLRFYHRGDKDYESLYINARSYGDSVYQQLNIEAQLDHFLLQRIQAHDQAASVCDAALITDMQNLCTDYLNFGHDDHSLTYRESRDWRFVIRPYLTGVSYSRCIRVW